MPLNIPGILVPFQLVIHPRLVLPALSVNDIRQIDFLALKKAGYRCVVFDKDNCLTIPHKDTLVPELQGSWKSCREAFGDDNVLIVSNSAGTYLDAGGIQSESVSYHLGVPVLSHKSFKPAYSCITAIRTYFSSLRSPIYDHELVIVGDRVFTDVVLANRMRMQSKLPLPQSATRPSDGMVQGSISTEKVTNDPALRTESAGGPLSIWTTSVWKKEGMPMRWLESALVRAVQRLSTPLPGEPVDCSRFIKRMEEAKPEASQKSGVLRYLLSRLRRS
ncbi:mitochondrial PGP phosphatase-domain-containing protein [Gymnopilus junonius]|uniref:Mitochondrial PGP phosphatase-domain-containing protein n=1 Tax=Gymnopilus junonius TaxID=109634 RepID=A0A9P5NQ79_GYMJU|nr:mitochondrial PGP phosphatase-domain-containing protein [Gymnopilus junonius]